MDERWEAKLRAAIEANSVDSELIESSRQLLIINEKFIESSERLIEARRNFIAQLESEPDRNPEILNEIEEQHVKLQDVIQKIEDCKRAVENPEFYATSSDLLQLFDIGSLPTDVRVSYFAWLLGYEETKNNHYVIEIFATLVRAGIYPPKWIMEILADGFYEYFKDPNRDPKRIGKKLGLEAQASGATNPWRERKTRSDRANAMIDMSKLMTEFGVSKRRAASAVKLKYQLSESESTMRKYFAKFFGSSKDAAASPGNTIPMTEYQRTKFVSSFPVAARKLIKT